MTKQKITKPIIVLPNQNFRDFDYFMHYETFMIYCALHYLKNRWYDETITTIGVISHVTGIAKKKIKSALIELEELGRIWKDGYNFSEIGYNDVITIKVIIYLELKEFVVVEFGFFRLGLTPLQFTVLCLINSWSARQSEKPVGLKMTQQRMSDILGINEKTARRTLEYLVRKGIATVDKSKRVHVYKVNHNHPVLK